MFQDSVPAGSYNDPFLSSVWSYVCVCYVCYVKFVCVWSYCLWSLCMWSLCVVCVEEGGRRRRRRRSPGYRIKNKNPTQRCGEKPMEKIEIAAPAGSGGIRQVWIGNSSDMAHYVHRRFGRRSVVRGPRGPGLLGIRGSVEPWRAWQTFT